MDQNKMLAKTENRPTAVSLREAAGAGGLPEFRTGFQLNPQICLGR